MWNYFLELIRPKIGNKCYEFVVSIKQYIIYSNLQEWAPPTKYGNFQQVSHRTWATKCLKLGLKYQMSILYFGQSLRVSTVHVKCDYLLKIRTLRKNNPFWEDGKLVGRWVRSQAQRQRIKLNNCIDLANSKVKTMRMNLHHYFSK